MGDIKHQFGFVAESVYGTPVTVSRFLEFTTETLELQKTMAQSEGIRSGRAFGGQGRRETRRMAGGTVTFEVPNAGFGLFLEHLLGGVATTNPGTLSFLHTFTRDSLTGLSLTLQKGVQQADAASTVQPFTYPGSKIVSMDFSIDQDGLLMCDVEFDTQTERDDIALATASYTDPVPFTYAEGALLVDSVALAAVRSIGSLKITNNLLTERFFLGNAGLKDEPLNQPLDQLTGTLDIEFQDPADAYDIFEADTSVQLDLQFTGPEIETSHNYEFNISIADARFEGETPKMGGPELVYMNVPFIGLDPSAGEPITIEYKTTDTLP